jgi:hypothetical protein
MDTPQHRSPQFYHPRRAHVHSLANELFVAANYFVGHFSDKWKRGRERIQEFSKKEMEK